MAQWGRPGTELEGGFYAVYDYPAWWHEYLRLEADPDVNSGVDIRDLYTHVLEHWSSYVIPDLLRFYPSIDADREHHLLARPWRFLREVILSLFGIPESLTGGTFARTQHHEEDQ